jgi:SRSO17 transposase
VAVSLSLANEHASLPVAFQLYLPEEWAGDPERRRKAGVCNDNWHGRKATIRMAGLHGHVLGFFAMALRRR